jgi:hypothetical protein
VIKMARKTRAEKLAEQEALRQLQEEQARQEYLPQLMKSLEKAQKYGFEVVITEGKLALVEQFHRDPEYTFSSEWSWGNQYDLEELEDKLAQWDRAHAEELARAAAKEAALNKLTKEERKLLGL